MFRDQNSLIVFIAAVLLGTIGVGVAYFTKPDPVAVAPPEPVPLAAAKLPDAAVAKENALPNAGSGQAGGAAGSPAGAAGGRFGGGPGGPPPGFGGGRGGLRGPTGAGAPGGA